VDDVDVIRELAQVAEYPLAALVLAHVVLYTELGELWPANHFLVEQTSFFLLLSAVRHILLTTVILEGDQTEAGRV
jgi:hypothetical protein